MTLRVDKIDDGRQSAAIIAFPPPDDDDERLHMKQREALQFRFSDIFDPSVSQDQVFNRVCLVRAKLIAPFSLRSSGGRSPI